MTASRWLAESPLTTLTRVSRGQELNAVTMEDGSTGVRASDVRQLIWTDAAPPDVQRKKTTVTIAKSGMRTVPL